MLSKVAFKTMATISSMAFACSRKLLLNPKCWTSTGQLHTATTLQCGVLARNKDGKYNVTMIPGDGVGPELMDSAQNVLKSISAPIEFEVQHLSEVCE